MSHHSLTGVIGAVQVNTVPVDTLLEILALAAALLALLVVWNVSRRLREQQSSAGQQAQETAALRDKVASLEQKLAQASAPKTDPEIANLQAAVEKLSKQVTETQARLAGQQREVANTILALALLPLGERQYQSKDMAGALDTYTRALELSPKNPAIHYRLGYIYAQKGELDTADKHLKEALKIDPAFNPALAALGYVHRRRAEDSLRGAYRERHFHDAERLLLKALYTSPRLLNEEGDSWWVTLGGLYRDRGQYTRAVEAYRRAIRITPYSSYPLANLALYEGMNDDSNAMIQSFREVERLSRQKIRATPEDYWPYADLLLARLALGKIQEAEETLNIILRILPHDLAYAGPRLVSALETLAHMMPEGGAQVSSVAEHIRNALADHAAAETNVSLSNEGFVIPFDYNLPALGVRISIQDQLGEIAKTLELHESRPAILILGGAMDMTSPEMQATRTIIEEALIPYAQENQLAIIDGGTDAGVMRLLGQGRHKNHATFPLVGVAPVNRVIYPGHDSPDGYDLESGHSHFILTSEGDWGDETDTMVQFTYVLTGEGAFPGLVMVINGGNIVRQEVYRLTVTERLRFPVLVLEGSGRFADTLAEACKSGVTEDEELQAIIKREGISLISVKVTPETFREKLDQYLTTPSRS